MRTKLAAAVCISFVLLLAGSASAQRGQRGARGQRPADAPARAATPAAATLDEEVQNAIEKGVGSIWADRQADGSWPLFNLQNEFLYTVGPTALAAYALLESGVSATDERMAKTLDWLANHNDRMTYTLGLRCQVWLIANRQTKNKYIKQFEADVKQLILAGPEGAYNYDANAADRKTLKERQDGKSAWDDSNGQFGVLGVWAGARANMEFIPDAYWNAVVKHWTDSQRADGVFMYSKDRDTGPAITAAGVATLLVCLDNNPALKEAFASCNAAPRPEQKVVARGLEWLEQNFQKNIQGPEPYYLYALERVGLASGLKYFGSSDWYQLGAEFLVRQQKANGAWRQSPGPEFTGNAFGVLFLVRGRNPVMFNKLQYEGDWNNRPRALASLTEWASKNFEQTVNWQIINLKVPVGDWHDAPVLFISGSKAPTFSEEEMGKLRTYIQQGGTIFSVGECAGRAFDKAMREVYTKLFPEYELKAVDKDHDLYISIQFPLKTKPHFFVLSNGIRPLAIHVEEDMVLPWQTRSSSTEGWAFQAAANVYLYVTDKGSLKEGSLKARGVNRWPADPGTTFLKKVKLARLKYGGNWDPEPLAYERFGRLLAGDAQVRLEPAVTEIKDVATSGVEVATLTGTGTFTLGAEEKDALKKFVEGGGLLVIDAAGGSRTFAESAENAIQDIFGVGALKRLDPTSPLYTSKAIKDYKYRRATRARMGGEKNPQMRGVMVGQRLGVIYSREDLTGGLVGYSSFGCDGYAPQTAFEIMRNAILLAAGLGAAPAAAPDPAAAAPAE